ncbi:MAG: hypothetical protein DSZ33_04050 [Gammaproteobacteria bacterium]|nr:MAG: hypothetical protein DSZ33_04050 [Gammaproteobacteria bacterium]
MPEVVLHRIDGRLTARLMASGRSMDICAQPPAIDCRPHSRDLSRKQPLAKALGAADSIIDATAGLAQDAMFMACLGYRVTAFERSPLLVQLVRDLLDNLDPANACSEAIRQRLALTQGDAIQLLPRCEQADVVYVDPMFPPKRRESALPRKDIQLIRSVVGDDADSRELFQAALEAAGKRVVVKRPHYAPPLAAGVHHSIKSKLLRYDVYLK